MFYIFGGVLFTSYLIYKYRNNVSYNLLRAFSYVEEYIPTQKQAINKNSNGLYCLNMNKYTLELKTSDFTLPEKLENSSIDMVYILNEKIYNSGLNTRNLDPETGTLNISDIVAASVTVTNDQEIDITELVCDFCINEFGLNLTLDTLPIILILYNEFYDGNLLIEEYVNNQVTFTIITNQGKIFSSSAMNFNITI